MASACHVAEPRSLPSGQPSGPGGGGGHAPGTPGCRPLRSGPVRPQPPTLRRGAPDAQSVPPWELRARARGTQRRVELPVTGVIPPDLEGRLLRNGPNPAVIPVDETDYHWFSGDGMVHAISLAGGRATGYRNRWVRTRALAAKTGTPPPRGPGEPIDGWANTHVIRHAGTTLALVESGLPPCPLARSRSGPGPRFRRRAGLADDRPPEGRPGHRGAGLLRHRCVRAAVPPLPRGRCHGVPGPHRGDRTSPGPP